MKNEDYPALYRAASNTTTRAQTLYTRIIFLLLLSVVSASICTLLAAFSILAAIAATSSFVFSLSLSLVLASKRYDSIWYRARAVAESVKTITWRYMMRSEPFNNTDSQARKSFVARLHAILDANPGVCDIVGDNEQITQAMATTRSLPLVSRIELYRVERIEDQSKWYTRKANLNRHSADYWFWIIAAIQLIAIALSSVQIAKQNWIVPSGVMATIATAAISWMQVKRFQELSTSYSLTAHEIGLIKSMVCDIEDEDAFSSFVADAENAFSREHTQWQARRDVSSLNTYQQ